MENREKEIAIEKIIKKIHQEEKKETSNENSGTLTALYNTIQIINNNKTEITKELIEKEMCWAANQEEVDKENRNFYTGYYKGNEYALKKIKEAIKWQKEKK